MVKLYLLWDFEELCGVFSTLDMAKEAAREQIGYRKREHLKNARRFKLGKIGKDFEGRDSLPKGFKQSQWRYWAVGYEVLGRAGHTVLIEEETLDKFESLLKRIYKRKEEQKRRRKMLNRLKRSKE